MPKTAQCALILLAASIVIFAAAQPAETASADQKANQDVDGYYEPLPQETGSAGLKLMLRRLNTTGRLMQVDAHPDDEDGGMLTLEARGKGVSTLLMTLTRGEGGQNELGSNLLTCWEWCGLWRCWQRTATTASSNDSRESRISDIRRLQKKLFRSGKGMTSRSPISCG